MASNASYYLMWMVRGEKPSLALCSSVSSRTTSSTQPTLAMLLPQIQLSCAIKQWPWGLIKWHDTVKRDQWIQNFLLLKYMCGWLQCILQENTLRSSCSRKPSSAMLILCTAGLFQKNLHCLLVIFSFRSWGVFSIITLIYSYTWERCSPVGSNSHTEEKFTFGFMHCFLSILTPEQQIPSHTLGMKPATTISQRKRWKKSHIHHTRLTQQINCKAQILKNLFRLSQYLSDVWTNIHVR